MILKKIFWSLFLMSMSLIQSSCTEFVETELPSSQMTGQAVFSDQATATAALINIYSGLRDQTLISGNSHGLGDLLGNYTDELDFYGLATATTYSFNTHSIISTDSEVANIWNRSYNLIYSSNSLLHGLDGNTSIGFKARNQLKGEALFLRSFIHFYLAQLFGDIPYVTSIDYKVNAQIRKEGWTEVHEKLVLDLEKAIGLLSEEYVDSERIRVNRAVAKAFLARVQLYGGLWEASLSLCNDVLSQSELYVWEDELDQVFLKSNTGTLWQLSSASSNGNTLEANNFIFEIGPPPNSALTKSLIDSFDSNDQRRINWTKSVTNGNEIWYHAYKYKARNTIENASEYSVVVRLAEVYLIRAEARMRLNDLNGAMADLNKVRNRAGLSNLTGLNEPEVIAAILKERRHEFFTEFGHRWFDLKRFHKAREVLEPIKPNWRDTNLLLPIPQSELLKNTNLNPQNDGY